MYDLLHLRCNVDNV